MSNIVNVGSIEEDIKILKNMIEEYENCSVPEIDMQVDVTFGKKEVNAIKTVLGNLEVLCDMQMSADRELESARRINEEHQKINGELREKVKELEEENKNLKAQHIFTRNNNATEQEKAELYDVIDKTIDTFLEQEKPIWQQEMTTNKMSLEEALSIVDEMYQNKYKIIEKNNTIYVDKLNDIKFTSLEFASVRLLREVQSLQYKLENSIPKQVVKEVLQNNRNKLFGMTYLSKEQYRPYEMQIERINKIEQELLGGESK